MKTENQAGLIGYEQIMLKFKTTPFCVFGNSLSNIILQILQVLSIANSLSWYLIELSTHESCRGRNWMIEDTQRTRMLSVEGEIDALK